MLGGQKGHRRALVDGTGLVLVMPDRVPEGRLAALGIEPRLPDDLRDPVLQFQGSVFQQRIVVVPLVEGRHVLLEVIDPLLDRVRPGFLRVQGGIDRRHLLAVGQPPVGDDAPDRRQGPQDTVPEPADELGDRAIPPLPLPVIRLLVLLLGRIEGRLDGAQQGVDQDVLQLERLVDDEGDQMQVAVVHGPAGHLGDLEPDHGVRVVADALEAQG